MGIDLELACVAAAHYAAMDGEATDQPGALDAACDGTCIETLTRDETEFRHRRFSEINETMRLTGMGFEARPDPGAPEMDYHSWRSQTVPGRTGIPAFKLCSNDRWLITPREIEEAPTAYATVPADRRATLEIDEVWAAWVRWLELARHHGGFEAE